MSSFHQMTMKEHVYKKLLEIKQKVRTKEGKLRDESLGETIERLLQERPKTEVDRINTAVENLHTSLISVFSSNKNPSHREDINIVCEHIRVLLQKANREKKEFLPVFSHDLEEILTKNQKNNKGGVENEGAKH